MKRIALSLIVILPLLVSCSDDNLSNTNPSYWGMLDITFNNPEGFALFNNPLNDKDTGVETAIQSDGKIVVMGYSYDGSKNTVLLLRYNEEGTLDNLFGTDGYVIFDGGLDQKGLGLALSQDGTIIVVGYIRYQRHRDVLVLRYCIDGNLDRVYTYSSGGEYTDIGFGAAVQADGKVVVVGERSNGDNQDILMIRLTSDLEPDSSFGDSGIVTYNGTGNENDKGFSVAVQGDGKIVAAGSHIAAGQENEDLLVLRFHTDGSLDTDFGTDGTFTYRYVGDNSDYGNSVTLQADGKIVTAGSAYDGQSFKILILRLESNGSLDSGFGTGGVVTYQGSPSIFDYAFGVAIEKNGGIVVAGASNNGSSDDAIVLMYTPYGILDSGFGDNGVFTFDGLARSEDRANGLAIQAAGKIVVTGYSHGGENDDVLTFRLR
ncbi:MAG: hypothetical protein QG577_1663 [Thermodesulfobacteriota bacterium]|nr:hypothetical protein [Thermodesulfobacteriota bacterium]